MKKIYFEPKMRVTVPQMKTAFLEMSLDNGNPSDLPGGGGKDDDDDDEEEWGGAKGRGLWDNDGLW